MEWEVDKKAYKAVAHSFERFRLLIVLNMLNEEGAGFAGDTLCKLSALLLIDSLALAATGWPYIAPKKRKEEALPMSMLILHILSKSAVADRILDWVLYFWGFARREV